MLTSLFKLPDNVATLDIPWPENGLLSLLPITFLHTKLTNKQIKVLNRKIAMQKAAEVLQPVAEARLESIRTQWKGYPNSYAHEMREHNRWYAWELDRRAHEIMNNRITNIISN